MQAGARKHVLEAVYAKLEKAADQMLDRVTDVSTPSVVAAFEKRIATLEEQKIVVQQKIAASDRPQRSLDAALRTALDFIGNPYKLWASGSFEHKR